MLDWHSCKICYPLEIKLLILFFYSFYITLTKCLLFALAHTIICLPYDVYICMQSEKNEFIQGRRNVNESVFVPF